MKSLLVLVSTAAITLVFAASTQAAPTITRVGVTTDGRISATWTLDPADELWHVEVSRSPATDKEGSFKNDIVVGEGVDFSSRQTSWTSPRPFNPGTYYVHVGAWNDAAHDVIWSPPTTVRVSYPLRTKRFDVNVSRTRDAALLSFDTRQCQTINMNPPTIPAEVTIRSSWRKRALRKRVTSVCSMDELGLQSFFTGYIIGSSSFIGWELEPNRDISTDGTFVEKLTITGRVRGRVVGRHVLRVRYTNQTSKRIWEGTDRFVNYCINGLHTTRSEGGRLYCKTNGSYRVKVTRIR